MQWLLDRFASAPDTLAFDHQGREVTYGAVVERVSDFTRQIRQEGIAPAPRSRSWRTIRRRSSA
jgi:hypothetical protein